MELVSTATLAGLCTQAWSVDGFQEGLFISMTTSSRSFVWNRWMDVHCPMVVSLPINYLSRYPVVRSHEKKYMDGPWLQATPDFSVSTLDPTGIRIISAESPNRTRPHVFQRIGCIPDAAL